MMPGYKTWNFIVLFSTVFFPAPKAAGQEISNIDNFRANIKIHYGFIISHRPSVNYLSTSHFPAWELSMEKQTFGLRRWEILYKYPVIGITYFYSHLGKNPHLGGGHAIYPFVNFPLNRIKALTIGFKVGCGLGYIERPFDRVSNYKNVVIGSGFNGVVSLHPNLTWKMGERLSTSQSFGLTHFSNGGMKTPNLGINLFTGSASFSYRFGNAEITPIKEPMGTSDPKHRFSLLLTAGIKEIYPAGGKKFFPYGINFSYSKLISTKTRMGGGIDFFSDRSMGYKISKTGTKAATIDNYRIGATFNFEIIFSDLSIPIQAGFYPVSPFGFDGLFYQRLGFNYRVTKNLFANITLKSHFAKADYFEWGLGYSF